MPTVSVNRNLLFSALGETFSDESFDELCFEFGIELDDITTADKIVRKEKHLEEDVPAVKDDEIIYKIEVPANRYDLLCLEGISRALRVFKGKEDVPTFRYASIAKGSMQKLTVSHETSLIRPFVVAAILRGITFNQHRYESFIDLQDKLHQNLCRKRTLVAIGTHDLDTLKGPFTYEALTPSQIKFVPLKQNKEFTADELMEFYKSDMKLKKYLSIIESSPVYPVIYDSNRTVASLPPIINGAHSAITLKTKNVFIECTGTDLTKAKIVLNTMVAMFSEYCANKFEVEQVEVSSDGKSVIYPDLSSRKMEVDVASVNDTIGTHLSPAEIAGHLGNMQLPAEVIGDGKTAKLIVTVPPTRSDVLHPCDVIEDVAISFGYNNLCKTVPNARTKMGKQQPLSHFADLIRIEIALAGFTEILTWILGSNVENFDMVNREMDADKAVSVANPRTSEFEVVRRSLLPGILKTMAHNKSCRKPVQLFEVADVVLLENPVEGEVAANERHLSALYCGQSSGFEVIHGLVDRVMIVTGVSRYADGELIGDYYLRPSNDPEYLADRQAHIIHKGSKVGSLGIVHPKVLRRFDIPDPCSVMELNIEAFL